MRRPYGAESHATSSTIATEARGSCWIPREMHDVTIGVLLIAAQCLAYGVGPDGWVSDGEVAAAFGVRAWHVEQVFTWREEPQSDWRERGWEEAWWGL